MSDYRLPDYIVHEIGDVRALSDNIPRYLSERGDWRRLKEITGNGQGIKVGVGDTGVDRQHLEGDLVNVIEAKDFTNSRSGTGDINGHGCIAPEDIVFTSNCGIQEIQTFFNRVTGVAVETEDGSEIKDISRHNIYTMSLDCSGETPKASRNKVTHVHKLKHKGDVYSVDVDGETLTLTPWHPVYTISSSRGKEKTVVKKRADELVEGDKICVIPKNDISISSDFIKLAKRRKYTCQKCGNTQLSVPISCNGKKPNGKRCAYGKYEPNDVEFFEVNEDFGFLLGLILTDGYIGKDCVEFTSSDGRHIELFNELSEKCGFGLPKEYDTRPDTRRVRIHDSELRHLLRALGFESGAKSKTMHLPEIICKSPRPVVESFFAGCIEGDGCISCDKVRLVTASDDFAESCVKLVKSLGVQCSKCLCVSDKSNFGPSRTWHINFGGWPGLADKMKVKKFTAKTKDRFCRQVKSITKKAYDGLMYDFTVEGTNNYVANGLVVSNTHVTCHIGAKADGQGIEGIASDCGMYHAKVLGDNGSGSSIGIAQGIDWMVAQGCKIINLSLGGGFSQQIENACKRASEAGVLVFAALGNDGTRGDGHPGNSKYTIGIAAVDYNKRLANFSSRSSQAIFAGYGVQVLSCITNGRYGRLSGTSMATPDQAGLAALICSYCEKLGKPIKDNKDYFDRVKPFAEDLGTDGWDRGYGYGFIDIWKFIEANPLPSDPVQPEPPIDPLDPPIECEDLGEFLGTVKLDGKDISLHAKDC